MEEWVPLFDIFLNSPTPESQASQWFHHHHQATSAFLSLLLRPTNSFPLTSNTTIWMQTLPPLVQSRVLSFLTIDHRRFSSPHLLSLATQLLDSTSAAASPDQHGFWVRRAARNLLDAVSSSIPFPPSQPSHEEDSDFDAIPHWLRDHAAATSGGLLPWLPLPHRQLPKRIHQKAVIFPAKIEREAIVEDGPFSEIGSFDPPLSIDPLVQEKASALRTELLAQDSTSKAPRLAVDIRQLCLNSGAGNHLMVLGMIEPWESDDETAAVLLSHLSGESGDGSVNWPAHVLCSIVLPKLLFLKSPAAHVLLSATISFCEHRPAAAVEALLFPLALRKEGINVMLCNFLVRIIKECLHPTHVSAFCQRLLSEGGKDGSFICLPCHREFIAEELVWTEPLFTLFQHIVSHDVPLTPDTVDRLVNVINEMAGKLAKSLKFGNFLLYFVAKCGKMAKFHKLSLERAVEKTDTFITKSILAKLGDL